MADFKTISLQEARDNILTTVKNLLTIEGFNDVDLGPGTFEHLFATSVAQQLAFLSLNSQVLANAQMPDSATGKDLDRIGAIYSVPRGGATTSSGYVYLDSTTSAAIALNSELIDTIGQKYKVTVAGTYADGDRIPVSSVTTGIGVNLAAGDSLRWVSPAAGVNRTCTVWEGGLTGGKDAQSNGEYRDSLLSFFRTPPSSGNWSHCKLLAETADASITAFIYPALNGPATVGVALAKPASTSTFSREVDGATVTVVSDYLTDNLPEHVYLNVVSVDDVNLDVAINLSLSSESGWKQPSVFPEPTASGYAAITAKTSDTVITVESDIGPSDGISQVCFWDDSAQELRRATVLSHTGTSSPYTITLDLPLTGCAVGDWIFPDAYNMESYVDALLTHFSSMGPGEGTTSAGLLPRATRRPKPSISNPYSPDSKMLRAITDSATEVLDAEFGYRSSTAQSTNWAPYIFIPRKLAFYKAE